MWHFHPEAAYSPLLISSLFPFFFFYSFKMFTQFIWNKLLQLWTKESLFCNSPKIYGLWNNFCPQRTLREKKPNNSTSWTKKRFSCIFHLFFFQWSLPVSPFFLAWSKHIKYALLQGFHWENLVAGYSPQLYKKYPRPPKFSSKNLQSNKQTL